jgi:hypothetical protein
MNHIVHLNHTGLFPPSNHLKSSFPYCCPTLSLGAMELHESHFCVWTGNFSVNLNSSGAVDLEEIFFTQALEGIESFITMIGDRFPKFYNASLHATFLKSLGPTLRHSIWNLSPIFNDPAWQKLNKTKSQHVI